MKARHQLRRTLSALAALTLGSTALTLATAPAAHAATDVVAKLPISSYSTMVVDSAHEHVFISDNRQSTSTPGTVLVYNFQGQQVASLATGQSSVSGMALSEDGATLYVVDLYRVARYDTATLAMTGATATGNGTCERQIAASGGKVWHTHTWQYYGGTYCTSGQYNLYGMNADGTSYTSTGWADAGILQLATGSGLANRLFMGQPLNSNAPDPFLTSFDTSGATLVRGNVRRFADSAGNGALNLKDMALSPDGRHLAVADAAYGTRLLDSGDLSDAPTGYQPLPQGATSSAVAFSGDGKYIARGASATGSTPDLLVQSADPANGTQAMEFAFEGALDGNRVAPRGLAWSQDGLRLFTVTTDGGNYWLHVIQPPAAQYDSRFVGTLTQTPAQAVAGEPLGIKGRLEFDGPAPTEPVKVRAVRNDANGTHELATAQVAADGTFTVLDVPDLVGTATYTVSYLGDLTHRPAADVSLTVDVAKAPSSITLTAPAEATLSAGVQITGKLTAQGRPLPDGISLNVERTDRIGTGTLSSVAVAADGTFTINDLPRTTRYVTYTVSYAGDPLHEGTSASATVLVNQR